MVAYKKQSVGCLAALILFCSVLKAQDASEIVGPFGSLNNTESSYIIPSNQAQDLLNVDLSNSTKSIKKRRGYGTAFTLNIDTSPVHGVYSFYDSNGADVSLYFNDRRMGVSVSGGSPTVFFSTGPNGSTYQCVDSAGSAYCANTSRTNIISVNSSTYSMISGFTSTGTMVAVTPERLVQAGFSNAPNMIWFSKANDFNTWTVGGNPTDPVQFTITSPGSGIKHITYAHGRVYWFKDSSFGYILTGTTLADWRVVTVNSFLGTIHNTSIFRDEVLYFQGNDGHFYAYDGSNLAKLSKDIQTTISQTQGRTSNSWTQSTQSEFETGYTTNTITTQFPGDVSLSSFNFLTQGSLTPGGSGEICACGGPPYYLSSSFTASSSFLLQTIKLRLATSGTVSHLSQAKILADNSDLPGTCLASSNLKTGSYAEYEARVDFSSSSIFLVSGTKYWIQIWQDPAVCGSPPHIIAVGNAGSGELVYCGASTINASLGYGVLGSTYSQSGTYHSAVKNSASLSSWDTFSDVAINNNGSHSFYIRSSTGVFYTSATVPSWTSISDGAIPTISTNPYFQIRDTLSTTSSSTTPRLQSFTQNWFEGSASDKTYAIYHDNANWWSVASGAGATANNKILKFNLINPGWYIYDIGMNGMYVRNQSLYFGSVSSGKIFKFGDVDNDNGSAISAYWKSKDFSGVSPFVDKDYKRLSFVASQQTSTMTVTYTVNGSSSTSYNVNLGSSTSSFIQSNSNLPLGKVGRTINIKFGNNATDQPWEVYGAGVDYTPKSWAPK